MIPIRAASLPLTAAFVNGWGSAGTGSGGVGVGFAPDVVSIGGGDGGADGWLSFAQITTPAVAIIARAAIRSMVERARKLNVMARDSSNLSASADRRGALAFPGYWLSGSGPQARSIGCQDPTAAGRLGT
jgi:hypothetical protein